MRIIVFLLFLVANIYAHPHIFIEYTVDFEFNDKKELKGFWVDMEFGEMFSASIIEGADDNGDGKFTKSETEKVYKMFFSNLENFNYYLHLNVNGKINENLTVKDFSVSVKDDLITYKYFIPLEPVKSGKVVLSMYDTEYFCSVEAKGKKAFKVIGGNVLVKSIKIVENEESSFYFDQLIPEECHLEF